MGDDASLLIGGNDQRRQIGGAAHGLQVCDVRSQCLDSAALDVAMSDVDAGNQSFRRQRCDFIPGRIADDEAPAEVLDAGPVRLKHVLPPKLECRRGQGERDGW